jgi:hypothetical protein
MSPMIIPLRKTATNTNSPAQAQGCQPSNASPVRALKNSRCTRPVSWNMTPKIVIRRKVVAPYTPGLALIKPHQYCQVESGL